MHDYLTVAIRSSVSADFIIKAPTLHDLHAFVVTSSQTDTPDEQSFRQNSRQKCRSDIKH